jgi:FkbM family methyltransferase
MEIMRKRLTNFISEKLNVRAKVQEIIRNRKQKEVESIARDKTKLEFLVRISPNGDVVLPEGMSSSKSQLHQDLFVLSQLNFKRSGFFVEFGATNGVDLSNSYLLEKFYGWTGILAEPAKVWHESLKNNRDARIDWRCVWNVSGSTIMFEECLEPEYSTLSSFKDADSHKTIRANSKQYGVETVSLIDLLRENNAPNHIDYLSIDTEGSEYEILSAFDFSSHSFGVITCEHNYTPNREKIHALLTSHGYVRKFESSSQFDDWYVKS